MKGRCHASVIAGRARRRSGTGAFGAEGAAGNGHVKDWRRTVGMFTDDPGMKELFAEAIKLREADRRKARRGQRRKPPAAS